MKYFRIRHKMAARAPQRANQRATPKCSVILAQITRQAESISAMRLSLYLATRESSSRRKEHP